MQQQIRLVPPTPGRTPNYRIRGTYLGSYVDRSAKTGDRKTAEKVLRAIKSEIESGKFGTGKAPTFGTAAMRYMVAGGERTFLAPIILRIGSVPLVDITQDMIDETAASICPRGLPATRNRTVYTPISAVLRHAKVHLPIARPRGAQGTPRRSFLRPEQAESYLAAAWEIHPRFAALVTILLYTGLRLSEALGLRIEDVDLAQGYADVGVTKNGEPQRAHLPPVAVKAIRLALAEPGNAKWGRPKQPRTTGSVFCLTKSGALYKLFRQVEERAGLTLPEGVAFHLARHTFGAWTRAAGGRLEETGRWTSKAGAKPYDHYEITDAAKVADRFPGAAGGGPKMKETG